MHIALDKARGSRVAVYSQICYVETDADINNELDEESLKTRMQNGFVIPRLAWRRLWPSAFVSDGSRWVSGGHSSITSPTLSLTVPGERDYGGLLLMVAPM